MSQTEVNIKHPPPTVERPPVRPLGVWTTFGWAVLAFAIPQAVFSAIAVIWFPNHLPGSVVGVTYDGTLVALAALILNPLQIALLAAIPPWRTGIGAAEYLGLTRFTLRDFLVGFLALEVFAAVSDAIVPLIGLDTVPPFQTEVFTTARANGWLAPLALAIVVVGPAGEEILFRGFLFRGWVMPGARGVVAVVVIAVLWALMHVQYAWVFVGQIFIIGLLLGWIRWRSGSTLLTIALHIVVNLESTIETMAKIGWTTR